MAKMLKYLSARIEFLFATLGRLLPKFDKSQFRNMFIYSNLKKNSTLSVLEI